MYSVCVHAHVLSDTFQIVYKLKHTLDKDQKSEYIYPTKINCISFISLSFILKF